MAVYSKMLPLLNEKSTRDMRRYTQKDIAQALGVSQATISRWMRSDEDISVVSLDTASKLAQWLGCEIGDLVTMRKPTVGRSEQAS